MTSLNSITLAVLLAEIALPLLGAEVGVMDSLTKLRFNAATPAIPAEGIAVDAARNESESFQVIIRGGDGE